MIDRMIKESAMTECGRWVRYSNRSDRERQAIWKHLHSHNPAMAKELESTCRNPEIQDLLNRFEATICIPSEALSILESQV